MVPLGSAPLSRRRLLRAAAGLAGASAATPAAASEPELSVMTRNLYLGVDLFRLFGAEDREELRAVAGELLAGVRAHPYAARADAIAAEVARTAPDVVCLQEAALVRTRAPSRFDGDHDPGATDVLVDLLDLLSAQLAARDLGYTVASALVTNDVEMPAETDEGPVDLRLTDRVAVLVRDEAAVTATRGGRFAAGVPVPLETVELTIRRGFAGVDLTVGGRPVVVASTHLESLADGVRAAQAGALADRLPDDRPVVVGGDLNSGPDHSPGAYERLRESFEDAHSARRPDAAGHTCCHDTDLRNATPSLSRRVDALLYRGTGPPTAVTQVGADAGARVRAEVDGDSVRVWPSDHAGVVASLPVPATATGTPTATATPTTTPTAPATPDNTPESQPGMGLVATAVAGAIALLSTLRRRRGGDR